MHRHWLHVRNGLAAIYHIHFDLQLGPCNLGDQSSQAGAKNLRIGTEYSSSLSIYFPHETPGFIVLSTRSMALPQVSRITTQQPPDTTHASNTPTEMADGQSPSGMGPWLGGRMRGDSLSSSGSGPKTPVLSQTQEMGRIEAVLVGTPLARSTSNRSSGLFVTNPSTPVSPGTTGYSRTHGTPTLQQGPEQRGSQAMEQIRHSVQRLQNGYLEETRIPDAEVQRPEVVPPRKKWWWQKPRWKGVQNRLVTVMIACMMCAIVLAICEYIPFSTDGDLILILEKILGWLSRSN